MSTTTQLCSTCTRPSPDAYLCRPCTSTLAGWLRELPWLTEALEDQMARLVSRHGERIKVRGRGERPLPVDLDAADLLWTTRSDLTALVRGICEERGVAYVPPRMVEPGFVGPLLPTWRRMVLGREEPLGSLALWLARNVECIALSPSAAEDYGVVDYLVREIRRTVDTRPPARLLGPCDCGADVRVAEGKGWAGCRACGAQYEVAAFSARMQRRLEQGLATAGEIASHLGGQVKPDTIGKWKRRGRLASRGQTQLGADLFRVGEVLALMPAATRGGS